MANMAYTEMLTLGLQAELISGTVLSESTDDKCTLIFSLCLHFLILLSHLHPVPYIWTFICAILRQDFPTVSLNSQTSPHIFKDSNPVDKNACLHPRISTEIFEDLIIVDSVMYLSLNQLLIGWCWVTFQFSNQ